MEQFKLNDKVILVARIPMGLPFGSECYISNMHATVEQGGGNYKLYYHLRKNKDDRYETIVTENEIKKVAK